jgi:hypothetical protein
MLRYVVLRHEGVAEPHFDVLFETEPGSMLQTWRLTQWPPGDSAQPAQKIRDHRRAFLDYQGDLTGGRGNVIRVDEGTCTFEREHDRLVIHLPHQRLVFQRNRASADDKAWHVWSEPAANA